MLIQNEQQLLNILLIYGTAPRQAPDIRRLIDTIKSVNAWPDMRIMVSGGLFNRAEGLWQEMEADCYAANAIEALHVALDDSPKPEDAQRTINRRKKRKQLATEIDHEEIQEEVMANL